VDPPVPAAGVAAGCALLVWPQRLAASDLLWDVAAAAGAAVRCEHAAQGGLGFWKRLHADRTMAEVAGMAEPPFLPPFTARRAPTPYPYPTIRGRRHGRAALPGAVHGARVCPSPARLAPPRMYASHQACGLAA